MNTSEFSGESAPDWTLKLTAVDQVNAWWGRAQRPYRAATKRALRYDWAIFLSFCEPSRICPLPASLDTLTTFVVWCRNEGKKLATVRRYLSTIALAHRVAKLVNPCDDEAVKLEIKGVYTAVPARQRQAKALGWNQIERFLTTTGDGLPATRERALLCVAYDTLARRSELVALDLEDIEFLPDGTGRALIRRSKTDPVGEGNTAYLSRTTVRYLNFWLKSAGIREAAVFRRVVGRGTADHLQGGRGRIGGRLSGDAIAQAFKRVAEWIKMPPDEVAQVSGHSIRIGATQDLLALNIDLGSVMQAGRWKTNRMPMLYGEHVLAARGGMARAAESQGRDRP